MRRTLVCGVLAALMTTAAAEAAGDEACKPTLAVREARMTHVRPPAVGRLWLALVSVDVSRCAADSGGEFDIVVSRLKENALDVEFRERFAWAPPSVNVGIDFSADEAVERVRIDNVTGCRCRD